MPPAIKQWIIAPPIPLGIQQELDGFSSILQQILFNRGVRSATAARHYTDANPPAGTDPFNLIGIPQAVERIQRAIKEKDRIVVYGDFDADGVTATALLTLALRQLGADARGYIPNRFDEGYGLNKEALDTLRDDQVNLVITVDCGIRSPLEADHAHRLGLDLIITDHHQPKEELPQAIAVINPKQPGDAYPDKNLAGVGLAYKLACALMDSGEADSSGAKTVARAEEYLDLVALGTVADLAPLKGENRSLVRAGLKYLRFPHRQGVMSLIGAAGLTAGRIKSNDIGFVLGPRLNAAGRLESALAALELLTTDNVARAAWLAQKLDSQNRERQRITVEISGIAEQLALAEDPEALLLFAVHPDFNPGVVGLAASRLSEKYYRPAIICHQGDEFTRASCRSIPELDITNTLDKVGDMLERHGGHAAAAGFTVRNELLPELIERLRREVEQKLSEIDLRPKMTIDAEISLSELHPNLLGELALLQPTGQENPEALFVTRGVRVSRYRTVGRESAHLKMSVTDGRITYDAIAFRQGYWSDQLPERIDLAFHYETNEYKEQTFLQLNVRDIKPAGSPD